MITRSTTRQLVWRHATLRIRHRPDYLASGNDHLDITVVAPAGAPLPITDTGYRSHFLPAAELAAAGGPLRFVTQWLDREAQSKRWQTIEFRWRQGDLFTGGRP